MFPHTKSLWLRCVRGLSSVGNHCPKTVLALFLVSLWNPAAASQESLVSPPPPKPALTAEPISPSTSKRFDHLQSFQGQILLGGSELQVVLAGVPPTPLTRAWQPSVLAVFERHGETWVQKTSLRGVELRNEAGPAYQPVAIDLGTDAESGAAYATYIYTAVGQKNVRQLVTFRFDPEVGRLAVLFDDYNDGSGPKAASQWHLRLTGDGAMTAAPRSDYGGVLGSSYVLAASGTDVTAIVGYRAFSVTELEGARTLAPQTSTKERQPLEGYEIYLTRRSAARVVRRVYDLKECLFGAFRPKTLPKPESRFSWILGCETDTPRTFVTLMTPPTDAGGARVSQPVFFFQPGGEPIIRTALFAGESLAVDVPPGIDLDIGDTAGGRLIEGAGPISMQRGEAKTIALAARPHAVLRIDLGIDKEAALLTLRRLDARSDGEAGVTGIDTASGNVKFIGYGTWLVKSWPVLVDVLPGGYEVMLARGGAGVFCRRTLRALEGEPATVRCSPPKPLPPDRLYADLSFSKGAQDPRAYGSALGVDLLTKAVGEVTTITARRKIHETTLIASLSIVDEATQLDMQVVPASPVLAARWAKVQPRKTQDVMATFAHFAHEEGGVSLLELGCPGPSVSLFEYELLVNRLNPDAVRLFGCRSGEDERELINLWTRLSVGRKQPLVLTSVSRLDAIQHPTVFPRLVLPTVRGREPASVLLAAARGGLLTLTAGARVELSKVFPVLPAGTTPLKGHAPTHGEALVVIAPAGEIVSGTVALYTEKGLLKSEPLATVTAPTEMRISFPWLADMQLIRAEVTATDGRILGTTLLRPFAALATATEGAIP